MIIDGKYSLRTQMHSWMKKLDRYCVTRYPGKEALVSSAGVELCSATFYFTVQIIILALPCVIRNIHFFGFFFNKNALFRGFIHSFSHKLKLPKKNILPGLAKFKELS